MFSEPQSVVLVKFKPGTRKGSPLRRIPSFAHFPLPTPFGPIGLLTRTRSSMCVPNGVVAHRELPRDRIVSGSGEIGTGDGESGDRGDPGCDPGYGGGGGRGPGRERRAFRTGCGDPRRRSHSYPGRGVTVSPTSTPSSRNLPRYPVVKYGRHRTRERIPSSPLPDGNLGNGRSN